MLREDSRRGINRGMALSYLERVEQIAAELDPSDRSVLAITCARLAQRLDRTNACTHVTQH